MRNLLTVSALLLTAPVAGKLISLAMIIGAFGTLSSSGGADPAKLAFEIQSSLWPATVGFLLGVIGIALAIYTIKNSPSFPRWYYWFVFVFSILIAVSQFWIGTVLALILFSFLLSNRDRIQQSTRTEQDDDANQIPL